MRILVADDHNALRCGLIQILREGHPRAEFGEAASTAETLELLSSQAWDLLILDIFMPGRGGLEVLQHVQDNYPDLPVLVLSSAPEEQLAIRVLKAGASGYLNKRAAPEELVQAVNRLLQGGRYVTTATAERLAAAVGRPDRELHETLSNREFQVVQLLLDGKSLKEIAAELSLSVKTVSVFHTRIWEKLQVQNDVELVHYALEHGLRRRE